VADENDPSKLARFLQRWRLIDLPLRASNEGYLLTNIQRGGWYGLHCAHRATTVLSWGLCEHRDPASCLATPPSKLACLSLGMAPVLIPLRPSNEHILIVRVPGARDRHGRHSTPLTNREICLSFQYSSP